MIIGNFTVDPILWQHIGATGTIPAYDPDNPKKPHIVTFDDSRANHILNKFAVRGLVQMNYGDDEEIKKPESLKLWKVFWERQIENQNQHNEDQKEKGNRYSRPTDQLDEHAKLLGLELLRPWRVAVKDNKETEELKGENMALKKSLEAMQAQMTEILIRMSGGKISAQAQPAQAETAQPTQPETVQTESVPTVSDDVVKERGIIEANKNKYKRLGESNMNLWVNKHWEDIMLMPEENKLELEEKYLKIYGAPFPATKI